MSGKPEEPLDGALLDRLYAVIESRRGADPASSWTAKLFEGGVGKIAQKVGEEATETVIASLASEDGDRGELVAEASDLLYHLLVLLLAAGVEPGEIVDELASRHQAGSPR